MHKHIIELYGQHKLKVAALVGLSFVLSAHSLAIPLVFGKMIDLMIHKQDFWMTIAVASLAPLINISRSCFGLLRQWVDFNKVWFPIQESLRMRTLNQYFSFSIGQLKERSSGYSREIITSGEGSLQNLSNIIVADVIPVFTRLIITIVMLMSVQKSIGFIIIFGLSIYGVTVWHMRKKYLPRIDSMQKKNIASSKQRGDLLAGAPLIKAFFKEGSMRERYRGFYLDAVATSIETKRYIRTRNVLIDTILLTTRYAANITCICLFYQNKITLGEIMTVRLWWDQVFDNIEHLSDQYQTVLSESKSAERFLDLINTPPAIGETPNSIRFQEVAGFIEFKHVSFGYPLDEGSDRHGKLVVRDISFSVDVGDDVAIVGSSGSGKTTILNLLVRAYDPTSGCIEIDGQNIRNIDVFDFRRHISLVDQSTLTMEMTVAENINLGAREPLSEEALLALCDSVQLNVTKLQQGLQTKIGEMGNRVSGGQRQRIAIARALASDARIMVLDEPTSALDAITEAKVQETIRKVTAGRTTITIAHRIATIQHCNKIIVLNDEGMIESIGTHKELLVKSPLYREFVEKQQILT